MQNRRFFLKTSIAAAGSLILSSFRRLALFTNPNENYNILLGRPTSNSIIISLLIKQDARVYLEYGTDKNNLVLKTTLTDIIKGIPSEILLSKLQSDKKYFYRLCYKRGNDASIIKGNLAGFHTKRKKNSSFVFTITADSHLGTQKHCDPALYQLTLNNVAKDEPDLHFALGDDFRASKVNNPSYTAIEQLYHTQREHLGTLCHSVPYFFILGNHELEAKAFYNGTADCLASWSTKARKKFIPNPVPDSFYSGNNIADTPDGIRQNYFAFEWGDVLFLTMDVFWYSNISAEDEEMREKQKNNDEGLTKEEKIKAREERMKSREENKGGKKKDGQNKRKDQWSFTIGKEQYDWLKKTLEESSAQYKFVMGHHVMGSCRGGVEWASTFEWGGSNRKGNPEFAANRPNWEMPIHDLFVKNKVTAFIQGHDHLFARQEKDGIAYITCPMCGDPGYNTYNSEAYLSGDKLSNTGHLKMLVTKEDVQMQYIKAVLPSDETAQGKNGTIVYAWSFANNKIVEHS